MRGEVGRRVLFVPLSVVQVAQARMHRLNYRRSAPTHLILHFAHSKLHARSVTGFPCIFDRKTGEEVDSSDII
jgi:hypothetical protein